jgi:hypothetical protein
MFKDNNKIDTTVDYCFSQDHTSATSVAWNMWEQNGVAIQLKVNCSYDN